MGSPIRLAPLPRRRVGGWSEYAPPPGLTHVLRSVWTYRTPPRSPRVEHRVLPDSGVSICVTWRETLEGRREDHEVLLIGPVLAPRTYVPEAGRVLQAVQLRPEWCRPVLGVAPEEHWDALRPLEAALRGMGTRGTRPATPQGHVLALAERHGDPLTELLGWVAERAGDALDAPRARLVHRALSRLESIPACRVGSVAKELGVSIRHLRRAIRAEVGMTPKYLQRERRLSALVAAADGCPAPAWSRLAVTHGFYDQAHLIQECRALTGRSPVELHRARRSQPVPFFQSTDPRRRDLP